MRRLLYRDRARLEIEILTLLAEKENLCIKYFLAGLPDAYKSMIMGIENSNIPITRDSIKTKLLQEVKDDVCRKSSNDDTALQVKLKDSWNETNVSKKPRCYNCNKYSHFSRDCRSKRKTKPTTQEPKLANTATNSIFFMALKVDNTNSTDCQQ
ncbi:uncharacterized protein [Mycetomoellerius zeteki]|uniref:uncharacterized protein n=1 Tax=Mycetomoellerius zeteki TaxID=64791 RepID=UPI00084EAEF1|nr:PREDICTED: uncharacterized protein LOC108727116 [Trachymyrmex zeteki]XP_018310559.1 PREDICTED: uncharacterized protein LOC108727116 [Trachymyrmex zeteki]XP_018310560.1 PREDICTED: uncharacterized protein LOC108727116 [Trachymyrmex zeteki]